MRKLFLILFITSSANIFGQQLPLYTQYYFNPFIYNPSQAGTSENINAFLIHRSQWNDIPGAPVTSVFSIDGPIKEKNIGLGVSLYNDNSDIINRMGINSSYSYKLDLGNEQNVFFGLGLGVSDNRVDFSKSLTQDVNDPLLMKQTQRETNLDASFGASYVWKKLIAGISVPQLLANSVEFVNNDSRAFYNLSRHYLLSAKYSFDVLPSKGISAYPMIMVRAAKGVPVQYDINAVAEWMEKGWFALSYKSDYAIGLNLGVNIGKSLKAGYAYDLITGPLNAYSGTSHEILLGYTFGKKEDDEITQKIQALESKNLEHEEQIKNNTEEIQKVRQELDKYKAETDSTLKNLKAPQTQSQIPDTTAGKGFVTAGLTEDFNDINGKRMIAGHYLVIGSFKNREFAERALKKYLEKGYTESKIMMNNKTDIHYVYVQKSEETQKLMDELMKVRKDEAPDSWIFHLED